MKFTDYPEIIIPFSNFIENDIVIIALGYHNFHIIEPFTSSRICGHNNLHIVLEGKGTLNINNTTYEVSAGDIFFTPPDIELSYYPDDNDPWKYIWFDFDGKNSKKYAEMLGFSDNNFHIRTNSLKNMLPLLQTVFINYIENISVDYYEVLSIFFKLIAIGTQIKNTSGSHLKKSILTYINYHFKRTTLTVNEICSYFNISHSYLCKLFQDDNYSVKSHIVNSRINEACKLLETTDLRINEIAYSVGFSNDIHFMKMFKKSIGITPSQYRNKINK